MAYMLSIVKYSGVIIILHKPKIIKFCERVLTLEAEQSSGTLDAIRMTVKSQRDNHFFNWFKICGLLHARETSSYNQTLSLKHIYLKISPFESQFSIDEHMISIMRTLTMRCTLRQQSRNPIHNLHCLLGTYLCKHACTKFPLKQIKEGQIGQRSGLVDFRHLHTG